MKKNNAQKAPNCLKCKHFYVTYEPRHPRGCRAYGFKTRGIPSMVVFQSSGKHCRLFVQREKSKGDKK